MHKYLYTSLFEIFRLFKILNSLNSINLHSIKRYIHLGFDLTTGEDIEKALVGLSGTSTA